MPVPKRRRCIGAFLASLLIGAAGGGLPKPAAAAELLELRLDGLQIPINLDHLDTWSRQSSLPPRADNDQAVWLDLLAPESRQDLKQLLRAPLLRDQGFGRQLLDSWAGGQMLAAVGALLTSPDGRSTTPLLQSTLRRLLEQRREVTGIELLRALPLPRLSLQLDQLIALAEQWRQQLELQRLALQRLQQLGLPLRQSIPLGFSDRTVRRPQRLLLAVPHRGEPLPLEIWPAPAAAAPAPWVLLLAGLGGNADQLGWLAGALAARGWSVVALQHPGSDGAALKAALDGQRPPPGAETLPTRLADVEAVLAAQRRGDLPVHGDGVVLMGHSLGGLTALLAAGLEPEPGLQARCLRALDRLPITNPSRLLQCQLPNTGIPTAPPRPTDLRGVVVFNGFGSLLWPDRGLRSVPVPVLLVGGSLDLVTPPLQEQLDLFLPPADGRNRLVLVDGGSHFSPVRMGAREEVVLRLGQQFVGVNTTSVQGVLLRLTTEFLRTLDQPLGLVPQRRLQEGVTAYVLDPATARRWSDLIRP